MAEVELIEIDAEVEDDVLPDGVEEETGGVDLFEFLDDGNLVDRLDVIPGGAQGVASQVTQLLDEAKQSMAPWLKQYKDALKLAKLEPEAKKKTFPFENASIVMMPFILETMLDFHSRSVPELVWAKRVVAVKTYGEQTEDKIKRAVRVANYMNFQVSEQMPNWRIEQDKMLLSLPCVGSAYKKTFFNGDEQEVRSDLLQGDEVIFDHDYKTFADAPDKFIEEEYTRNEVLTFIRGAAQWKLDEDVLPKLMDKRDPFKFVRAYTWIDLDDDGLLEPYEVVLYKETETVVSVYPAYDEDEITANDDGEIVDVKMTNVFTQYQFLPDPEGGPMGLGWGILLGDLFSAINTNVRQLIDAGTLANLAGNSGLIDAQMSGGSGRGNRQQSGPIEVRMGELTPITTGGKTLSQAVVQFPYEGPNATLFQLLQYLIEQIRGMTNSALNMDTNNQEAAMMYLARLQQGLKVPNSIVMRVYNSAKDEFKKIAALNFKHYSNKKYNCVVDSPAEGGEADMRADFNPDDCDIRLAVDPSQGSDIERQQRADLVLQEAKEQPQQVLSLRQAYLDWLAALNVADIERLAPAPTGEVDPMQKALMANMQREAELENRAMDLKEADQDLRRAEIAARTAKEMAAHGLSTDKTEAEIADIYASAFKKLWEIGMAGADPIRTVQDLEGRLIDKHIAPPPPVPLDSPEPNPQPAGLPPQ